MLRNIRLQTDMKLLLLAIVLAFGSFLFFRLLLSGSVPSYATEIAAAFLGSLLTIVITAVMLNKQSEVDMRKDRNAKMLEAKMKLYDDLMGEMKGIIAAGEVTVQNIVAVQLLNLRLAYTASHDVVKTFSSFAEQFIVAARDTKLSVDEINGLLSTLGDVSVKMRKDLLSGEELQSFDESEFRTDVRRNVEKLKASNITVEEFKALCSPEEREYFSHVLDHLETTGASYGPRTKGITIRDSTGNAVAWCYPMSTGRSIELLLGRLSSDEHRKEIISFCEAQGFEAARLQGSRIAFKPHEMRVEDFCAVLDMLLQTGEPPRSS